MIELIPHFEILMIHFLLNFLQEMNMRRKCEAWNFISSSI